MAEEKIDDKTVKLYLGGICTAWSNEHLKGILSQHGAVKRVDVVKHYAFAFAETQEDADKIIAGVSGKTFEGYRIVVQVSKNKQNLPDCEDLCFECGKPGHWAKECKQRRDRYARNPPGRGGFTPNRGGPYSRPPPNGAYGRYPPGPPSRDPYAYDRDPYARPAYSRDPYARDPYARDPYARDPYARDPYARDPYARDPYARDPYATRDPYAYPPATGRYDYRERSPPGARYGAAGDLYAEERRRLAYGSAGSNASTPLPERRDPYGDPHAQRPADPYNTPTAAPPAARPVDPYATTATNHYPATQYSSYPSQ